MWISVGCYESFMVVYLVGVCLLLCASVMNGRCKRRVFVLLCIGAAIALLEIVLRSLTVSVVTTVFGLEHLRDETPVRSIMEMAGWMTDPENVGLFGMIVKRIYAMYCVFGYAYYPIKIYVFACLVIGVVCVWMSIRRKNLWISILGVGSFVASYLLALVEGKATLYRSAQFLPLVSAWGCLLAVYAVQEIGFPKIKKAANVILALALGCVLWNQCTDLNRWFYVDDMKYQEAKETVAFTGTYLVPEGIIEDAYVTINSPVHFKMAALTNPIDEYLLSK